jgi:hypothetical protein
MLPFSVVEPYVRRKEVAVHRLAQEQASSETIFISRRDTLRSLALEEFVRTLNEAVRTGFDSPRLHLPDFEGLTGIRR